MNFLKFTQRLMLLVALFCLPLLSQTAASSGNTKAATTPTTKSASAGPKLDINTATKISLRPCRVSAPPTHRRSSMAGLITRRTIW
jgi:hypothetical protein